MRLGTIQTEVGPRAAVAPQGGAALVDGYADLSRVEVTIEGVGSIRNVLRGA